MFLLFHQLNDPVDPIPNVICASDDITHAMTELSEEDRVPDLSTINLETLNRLCEDPDQAMTPGRAPVKVSSTPQKVGKELINTCVTPSRAKKVQQTLEKEKERHLCALKLLPFFFSRDELASSNTEGSHQKKSLDSNKLNTIKLLVFSKFPVSSSEEKDKSWRFIKGKINSKCRTSKHSVKEL